MRRGETQRERGMYRGEEGSMKKLARRRRQEGGDKRRE